MKPVDDSYLVSTFYLGDTCWGIDTKRTQEIIKIPDITAVRNAPEYVVGIINLRGKIVTTIDLYSKIGLPGRCNLQKCQIIIVDWKSEYIGLVVDSVSDVVEVGSLSPPPTTINGIKGSFIKGVYRAENSLIAILDINTVLEIQEKTI